MSDLKKKRDAQFLHSPSSQEQFLQKENLSSIAEALLLLHHYH
ncbi:MULTISPECIES: hypothetical protein [Cytobacillus]|nr:hypothetical protein [Cytobacillus sp. Bac17]